jgi:hypothetical protein
VQAVAIGGPTPDPVAVAGDPTASIPALERLLRRGRAAPAIQRALAANPAVPPSLLRRLVSLGRWDVLAPALTHPSCPEALVRKHARAEPWAVRAALAGSKATPPDLLDGYARDIRPVRFALAGNPAASPAALMVLLGEGDDYVRGRAAANPAAPAHGLVALATDLKEPAWTLRNIARNPACPADLAEEILTWLALGGAGAANASFDPVSCAGHPGDPEVSEWYWYRQASTADRSPENHALWRVRQTVAQQDRVPYPALDVLAQDPHDDVRRAAARFETLSTARLDEMAEDADPVVARIARTTRERKQAGLRGRPVHRRVSTVRAAIVLAAVGAIVLVFLALRRDDAPAPDGLRALDVPAMVHGGPPPPFAGTPATASLPGGGVVTVGLVLTADGTNDALGLYFQGGDQALTVTGVAGVAANGAVTTLPAVFTLDANGTEEVAWPHFTGTAVRVRLQSGGHVDELPIAVPPPSP